MSTIYISPNGSGTKTGDSYDNSLSFSELKNAIKMAGPGGEVLLIADKGSYNFGGSDTVHIYSGGTDGNPISIRGVSSDGQPMDAQFYGSRNPDYEAGMWKGPELFRLYSGADNLTFSNIDVHNTGTVFLVGGEVSNLVISDVDAQNVSRFLENYAAGSATSASVDGLTLRNIDVEGFSKGVIRLQYDSHDILIENLHADTAGVAPENFPIGIHLQGSVHDVRIVNTVIENAQYKSGTYWNGDAFATENRTYNIVFEDTVARGSTDGGYDLKSDSTVLIGALAEDNGKNYRFWGEAEMIDSIGLNPHKWGGQTNKQEQVQTMPGAQVIIRDSIFADAGSNTVIFDNDGSLTLDGVKVYMSEDALFQMGNGFSKDGIEVITVDTQGTYSPGYMPADMPAMPQGPDADTEEPATETPPSGDDNNSGAPETDGGGTENNSGQDDSDATPAPAPTGKITVNANGSYAGTAGSEIYYVDAGAVTGAVKIGDFGKEDVLVTTAKYSDSNGDGIITFGSDGVLNETDGDTLSLGGSKGIRYLGEAEDGGYIYVDKYSDGVAASDLKKAAPEETSQPSEESNEPSEQPSQPPEQPNPASGNKIYIDTNGATFSGSSTQEVYVLDIADVTGRTSIKQFGVEDVLLTTEKYHDGNGDGIITFGSDKVLNESDGDTLDLGGTNAVRYLGQSDGYHIYADAKVKPTTAKEGTSANDVWTGDSNDTVENRYFFDNRLDVALGQDTIKKFGGTDSIMTTEALEVGSDGLVHAGAEGFNLNPDVEGAADYVKISTINGSAISVLELDRAVDVRGSTYYFYSTIDVDHLF